MDTSNLITQKREYYNRQMPALPPKEEPAPYQANPSGAAREVIANTPTEAPRVSLANMAEKPDPTAPNKTFLQQQQEFYDKVTAAQNGVETPEQEAARKKRDALRTGLATFADGLAALSNLYYTTKWAPNQNIERQLPKLQQELYKERLERDAKLQRFREWQRQKAAQGEKDKRDMDLFKMKQAAAEREAEQARRWNIYKFDAEQAAKAKEAERKAAENAARAKETERHNREMERIGWTRANRKESNKGKETKKEKPRYGVYRTRNKNGEFVEFDLNKDSDVARMYNQMEEVYGDNVNNYDFMPEERPKTIQGMREFIIGATGKLASRTVYNKSGKKPNPMN